MSNHAYSRSRDALVIRALGGLTAALAVVALMTAAFAAAAQGPIAPGRHELVPLEQVGRWVSPPVNVQQLAREDAAEMRGDMPLRIGYPMTTDLSPANSGTWEALKDGGRIWRLSVTTDSAIWVVLGFDVFRIPEGASLWVYDPAMTTVMGPYTASDVRSHGQLWMPPIEGDTLVVELYWPEKLGGQDPTLHLGTVSHGYKPFGTIGRRLMGGEGFGDSGACNIDTMCPQAAQWQNEKRGVVILLSGGSGFCSGSLINTTANDCRPYVLTAHHCGAGASTVFGFNFERPGCATGTPPPETTQIVTGATVLADYASSDFTLLQMSGPPPASFLAYFPGWNAATPAPTETHVIHHPAGDAKKISYDADPAVDGTNYGANHWRIEQYTWGTTEGGSSGSPLFNQDHHIIGQLHGGTASCSSITWDEYGKVAVSWVGGGTPATRLSDWLDPNVTGQLDMNGVDATICAFNPVGSVSFARDTYACSDTLTLTVRDDSLRGNPTQDITIASGTEPTPETVTLTATEAGSGIFTGTFPIAAIPPVHGDGTLSVSAGDTITATYIDADDGGGGVNIPRTATSQVDCTGPAISNVHTTNVTGNSARVLWDTDEASNSYVTFDTSFPPSAGSASSVTMAVSHLVNLTGLSPCTLYYYSVRSTDGAGNTTTSTNGGAYYTFTTGVNVNPTYSATRRPGRSDPRQQPDGRHLDDQRHGQQGGPEGHGPREHHAHLRRRPDAAPDRP